MPRLWCLNRITNSGLGGNGHPILSRWITTLHGPFTRIPDPQSRAFTVNQRHVHEPMVWFHHALGTIESAFCCARRAHHIMGKFD